MNDDKGRKHVESLVADGLRHTAVTDTAHKLSPIRSVGIVGAGLMGTAAAAAAIHAGLHVVITDVTADALAAANKNIAAELVAPRVLLSAAATTASSVEQHQVLNPREAATIVESRLNTTANVAEVAACDLILESVAENQRVKKELYARFEPLMGEHAVLGTNTSTIPIGELAASLSRPDRFCGIHFFHPLRQRPLVEIIRGPQTSDATVNAARRFAVSLSKLPIEVKDGPGFLVNRLLLPYVSEAMELLLEGVTIEAIECAAEEFGMAKGPLRLLDEIGLDTALQGGWVLSSAFPDRIVSSPLLVAMIKAGNLGAKTGNGFFQHVSGSDEERQDKPLHVAGGVVELIEKWKHEPDPREATKPLDDATIIERLLLPMVLEATRLIEDQTVSSPGEIDLGAIFALGFPIDRGGLLYWADSIGPSRIVERLTPLQHLGPRAKPTQMLTDMAAGGRTFY